MQLREEAHAQVLAAEAIAQAATARAQETEQALGGVRQERQAIQQRLAETQADLARAQSEVTALQRQVDAGLGQRRELQEAINAAQLRFTHELEQQRTTTAASEERHAASMRRVLLDIDRERGITAKLQKELELARRMVADQAELHRLQLAEKQKQADAFRQKNGELDGSIAELKGQRDQLLREVADLRQRLETLPAPTPTPARRVKRSPKPGASAKAAK